MSALPTLSHIEMVMRIHWSPNAVDWSDERQCRVARELVPFGLVVLRDDRYHTTERGQVYVEALRATPLPVQSWTMP